jgi:hypothetical protein
MPLVQSLLDSPDGKSYYTLYPLRPGITSIEVKELLPYANGNYKYVTRFYHDIPELKIGITPSALVVSGNGLSYIETDAQNDFAIYTSSPIKEGAELAWTFQNSVQTVPSDIERNAMIIGSLLLLGFVLALWHAFNRSHNGMQ